MAALHQGFRDAYAAYLDKASRFADPPAIGTRWPREGYFLPDAATFMTEAYRRTAPQTLAVLDALAQRRGTPSQEAATAGAER